MTSYFNVKKLRRQSKQATSPDVAQPSVASPSAEEAPVSPVLDEQDEKFLERLAAIAQSPDSTPPPLPERRTLILDNEEKAKGKDAQQAIMNGADKVPLPMSPPEIVVDDGESKGKEKEDEAKKKSIMSYFALAQSKLKSAKDSSKEKKEEKEKEKEKDKQKKKDKSDKKGKEKAAKDLHAAAESAKDTEEQEAKKEEQDISEILDQLNLSAVNNRVFSFSKESAELVDKFKLVLKDVVNGAPTAYHDLEKLLTESDTQLKKMYGNLPPFLQNLVKSLPTKVTAALGPELLAAQAEKPGFDAKQQAAAQASTSSDFKKKAAKKLKKSTVPSLKQLVSAEGAVATMLRSILNFLKLRFPALMTGTNLLMSLAVFLLLFVFWYCHKRGRETRLEAERLAAEQGGDAGSARSSMSSLSQASSFDGTPVKEKGDPPLIISDGKEPPDERVQDLPSVLDLPSPKAVPLPGSDATTPLKEEPLLK